MRLVKDIYSIKLLLNLLARRQAGNDLFIQGGSVGELAFGIWPFRASNFIRRAVAFFNLKLDKSQHDDFSFQELRNEIKALRGIPSINMAELEKLAHEKKLIFIAQNLNEYFCVKCECRLLNTLAGCCDVIVLHPILNGKPQKKYKNFSNIVFGMREIPLDTEGDSIYISLFSTALLGDAIRSRALRLVPGQQACLCATCLRNRRQLNI
ncbi:hypothetical protein [Stutzerimonas azotifigens]|uniref:hypothetical protein n=1 Tax=Stutzerimonas azotifigens TaxID=291995 RepID=UPI00126909D5|nr:hypothetical protein [Stutzerimonas azotifigens]